MQGRYLQRRLWSFCIHHSLKVYFKHGMSVFLHDGAWHRFSFFFTLLLKSVCISVGLFPVRCAVWCSFCSTCWLRHVRKHSAFLVSRVFFRRCLALHFYALLVERFTFSAHIVLDGRDCKTTVFRQSQSWHEGLWQVSVLKCLVMSVAQKA